MDPAIVLTAFATIFVLELPDKTMLATIVLSARYRRPFAVWLGAATALTAQMAIAVAAGRLLDLLPDRAVQLGAAALFATGAVVLWRSASSDTEPEIAEIGNELPSDPVGGRPALAWWRISATVAGVVFLAEWGDLTQLAAASLAAARANPLSVFVGATLAMVSVAAIGAVAGQALLRILPEKILRRVAAGIFATLAVLAVVEAF